MTARTIETPVHGRFFFEERGTSRLLVGFHGYAQVAEWTIDELRLIPGSEGWSLLSVQALHPFYTRKGNVVASWMTRLDRDIAIADNLRYLRAVLAEVPPAETIVFAGFWEGAAMAVRAASHVPPCHGAILLGGDVPPELKADPAVQLPPVLLGRGNRDEFYSEEKFKEDLSFLESRTRVVRCRFVGGHEWTDEFREAAGEFLKRVAEGHG